LPTERLIDRLNAMQMDWAALLMGAVWGGLIGVIG
jgi:hypothetical protein